MLFIVMYLTAAPAQLKAGDSCQLNHALAVEIKRGKKKKAEAVAKGETLKVLELGKKEATVEGKIGKGQVALGDLQKFCVAAAPPEPKPTTIVATPASQPVVVAPAPLPASAPVAPTLYVPKKTTSVTIGALVMPPNTKKEVIDSVRNLMLEVIRTSGTLDHVESPELSEKEATACVQSNTCLGERAKNAKAEYAIGAWLKAEKNRGVLDFRLVDSQNRPGNATLRAINDPSEVDTETVTALKIVLRGLIPEDAGLLVVRANENLADVKIDGQLVARTPMQPTKLRTGAHDLEVEKARFITARQRITVDPGRDNVAEVWLDPKPDYKAEYKRQNGLLRALAWTGVGVGIAGTVGAFALRVGANRLQDGVENDFRRLDATYRGQPVTDDVTAQYNRVYARAKWLPVLDGLTWTMGALAIAGAATAITCFVIGDDPARYDHKPKTDVRLSMDVGIGNIMLKGEF